MANKHSFGDLLDAVEKMADEDQDTFMEILERRRVARRRSILARDIAEARRELAEGKSIPRTPQEIMDDILS